MNVANNLGSELTCGSFPLPPILEDNGGSIKPCDWRLGRDPEPETLANCVWIPGPQAVTVNVCYFKLLNVGVTCYVAIDNWYMGLWASQVAVVVKNWPANAGDARDLGSIPGLARSPGEGDGYPLQYSCLENPMDWRDTVHGFTELDTSEVT